MSEILCKYKTIVCNCGYTEKYPGYYCTGLYGEMNCQAKQNSRKTDVCEFMDTKDRVISGNYKEFEYSEEQGPWYNGYIRIGETLVPLEFVEYLRIRDGGRTLIDYENGRRIE